MSRQVTLIKLARYQCISHPSTIFHNQNQCTINEQHLVKVR